MGHSLRRVLVHLVFSTKHRLPLLKTDGDLQTCLNLFMAGVLKNLGCSPIMVNGYLDHMHPFFVLSPTVCLSDVVETVKAASTKWLRKQGGDLEFFAWQRGYAAFSVSPLRAEKTRRYVRNQRAHHERTTYLEELDDLHRLASLGP